MRGAVLLSLLLSSVAACAGDTVGERGASLELGTGSWRFEPLEDGQELELVRGAQGGWHVWLSVRTRGLADRSVLTLTMQPADESRPARSATVTMALDPANDEGFRDFVGYTGILDDPSCLVGEMMRVEAVAEVDGERLVSERYFVPTGGSYPPPPCGAAE